jgi:hypothetical protein
MRIIMRRVAALLAGAAFMLACGAPQSMGSTTPSIPISQCPPLPSKPTPATGSKALRLAPVPVREIPAEHRTTHPPRVSPSELIACVGTNQISGATFDHWLRIAWLAQKPRARLRELPALSANALDFLIQAQWIAGEAATLGISISPRALHKRYVRLRNQQFPHGRGFNAFLRSSGDTVLDLLLRTRIQMLSSAIRRHVLGGRHGKQAERSVTRFVRQFKLRWQAQTYCQALLKTPLCGHVLPQS